MVLTREYQVRIQSSGEYTSDWRAQMLRRCTVSWEYDIIYSNDQGSSYKCFALYEQGGEDFSYQPRRNWQILRSSHVARSEQTREGHFDTGITTSLSTTSSSSGNVVKMIRETARCGRGRWAPGAIHGIPRCRVLVVCK